MPHIKSVIVKTPVTTIIVGLNIFVFLFMELTGGSTDSINLYRWGAKYGPAIANGEWWRLLTPIFIHIGVLHLLTNTVGLIIFGSMAERIFGPVQMTLLYVGSGMTGNFFSFLVSPALGAGASGAVFGVISGFGIYLLINKKTLGHQAKQSLSSIALIVCLNLIMGFTIRGIDNAAHIGGLLSGLLIGYLLAPRSRATELILGIENVQRTVINIRNNRSIIKRNILVLMILIAIATVGIWVKARDYTYIDGFQRYGYGFMEFRKGNIFPPLTNMVQRNDID